MQAVPAFRGERRERWQYIDMFRETLDPEVVGRTETWQGLPLPGNQHEHPHGVGELEDCFQLQGRAPFHGRKHSRVRVIRNTSRLDQGEP